jgi:hypothetical protein
MTITEENLATPEVDIDTGTEENLATPEVDIDTGAPVSI